MKKILFFVVIIFITPLFLISIQGGNPFLILYGMVKLPFDSDNIVKISENTYIAYSEEGDDILKKTIEEQGYIFQEQLGSGLFFENKFGEKKIVEGKMLTQIYRIYSVE